MDVFNENKSFNIMLSAYFILLPFVFFSAISDPFLLTRQLLTNLILFFALIQLVRNHKSITKFSLDITTFLFFGFIFFCGLSFINSQIIDISHVVFSKYLTLFLFLFLIKHLINNNLIRVNQIIFCIILFGVLALIITILAFTNKTINGQNLFRQVDIMSGTFGNKNLLSSILFSCLPFYLVGISISKKIKAISIAAIVLTLFFLFLLRTRTVFIALGVFGFLILCYYIKLKFSRKTLIVSLILLIAIISATVYFLFTIKNEFHSSPNVIIHYFYRLLSSNTFNSRLEFWKQATYIIKDNFFNGIGVGNWIAIYPKYGLDHFSNIDIQNGRMLINNTHNDFLQVFLEIGVFGFLCYVGIFITILHQAFWLSINEKNSAARKNAAYFLFFIICYLIIAFFDFPLARIEHQILLLVVFMIINSNYLVAKKSSVFKISSRYVYLFCVCTLIYSSTVVYFRINGEKHLYKAIAAEKYGDNASYIFEINKAKNPFFNTDNHAIPLDWHIGKANFNNGSFKESLYHYEEAYKINPYSIVVNNDLASAFVKNNNLTEGISHYKKALKLSPNYIDARLNLAATYYNTEQYEKAFETIEKCESNLDTDFYNQIIVVIVEKKLNSSLVKINNEKLNNYLKSKIKSEKELKSLYFDYKKNNSTFDTYIQTLIN